MLEKLELISSINLAFDKVRDLLNLPNDEALARHWSVSPKTVSLWRNGIWTNADKALITMLVSVLCVRNEEVLT